jgi:hypothetical protein
MIIVADPIDADTLRARHEFLTRRDLEVSADGMAELLDVPLRHAVIVLDALVRESFLRRTADGRYARMSAVGCAWSH